RTALLSQLAELPLARQQRVAAVAGVHASPEPSGRGKNLSTGSDVRGADAVTPPERPGLLEMVDDRDLTEEKVNEACARGAHLAHDPAAAVVVGQRRDLRKILEGQEGCGARALLLEIGHGRSRLIEALDDDPFQTLTQDGLYGSFEIG